MIKQRRPSRQGEHGAVFLFLRFPQPSLKGLQSLWGEGEVCFRAGGLSFFKAEAVFPSPDMDNWRVGFSLGLDTPPDWSLAAGMTVAELEIIKLRKRILLECHKNPSFQIAFISILQSAAGGKGDGQHRAGRFPGL